MKIFFVAMPFSIHTLRWISQLNKTNWEVHLFSSFNYAQPHKDFKNIFYHDYFYNLPKKTNINIKYKSILPFEPNLNSEKLKKIIGKFNRFVRIEKSQEEKLLYAINKVRPDIIHTLETQHAAYLLAQIWPKVRHKPIWIHSNWGIDLDFFGKIDEHISKIKDVLKKIDIFISEGNRDLKLAQGFGFQKKTYIFPSVGGGFDIQKYNSENTIEPSQRKLILLKGTQDIVRRALFGLRALEKCIDLLDDYEIIIYNCEESVKIAAELFYKRNKKKITILNDVSHEEMIKLNGKAIISISINLSDGLPNSVLEAMVMGAFPIQSNTSCADEWITDGLTGFLVPPEDPDIIAEAIKKALTNHQLINDAAIINSKLIADKLNYETIQNQAINMYIDTYKSFIKNN